MEKELLLLHVSLVPVFLDFPIQFIRHLLELLFSIHRCDAVNCDPIGEGGFPLVMSVTRVIPLDLAQWTWVSLDIACVLPGKPGINPKRISNRAHLFQSPTYATSASQHKNFAYFGYGVGHEVLPRRSASIRERYRNQRPLHPPINLEWPPD